MKADKMIDLLNKLIPTNGVKEEVVKNVNLFRITSSTPRLPQKYDPGIIILAQGSKKILLAMIPSFTIP
ncbi:MAG: hypothetical protein JXR48_05830 [Candidatus Delongbacteria bacterium]|nr:hypothetical protein [Candidatus Delongbacteria bacterium]MBN2834470.1 hypothetical protein [Candidatus Delongbacteria bacterium]